MLQKKHLRLAAGIFALLLLCAVLLSANYLAKEAEHHDCVCEHCSICACLRLCRSILTGLFACTTARFAIAAACGFGAALFAAVFFAAADATPVAHKVRLDC